MKKLLMIFVVISVIFSCSKRDDKLRIGIIKPSLNHLPLDFAFNVKDLDQEVYNIFSFKSGWETNEALISGRIDVAIMPFTYAWKAVSIGKPVKIISFFERESDGIITTKNVNNIQELDGKKLGVLKASTLDIFAHRMLNENNISMEFEYFRTPMDMASALKKGNVDALSYYVPSIYAFDEGKFHIIYWFSDDYPKHPCCNLISRDEVIKNRKSELEILVSGLRKSAITLTNNPQIAYEAAYEFFGVSLEVAKKSLRHTKYVTGLEEEGKIFEEKSASIMKDLGYLTKSMKREDVYYPIP